MRKVWLLKAPVSAGAGAMVQVPTQCPLSGILLSPFGDLETFDCGGQILCPKIKVSQRKAQALRLAGRPGPSHSQFG
jgi:hypothetical protein